MDSHSCYKFVLLASFISPCNSKFELEHGGKHEKKGEDITLFSLSIDIHPVSYHQSTVSIAVLFSFLTKSLVSSIRSIKPDMKL